jgi:hypothetical protein
VPGVDLQPGERVLARAAAPDGEVFATTQRLLLPVDGKLETVRWEAVERARWDEGTEQLVVVETAALGSRPRRHRIAVGRVPRLLDVVREQVQASVLLTRHVPITEQLGVRITARRPPGGQRVSWAVAVERGLDLDDPQVRARVDRAVAQVRAEIE